MQWDNMLTVFVHILIYLHSPKSVATLDDEIVDPEITVKLEMRDVLKVDDAQT